MSEELVNANSEGKLAKATARVLVGNNQYATMAVTCHVRTRHTSTGDDIERLGEQYLTNASIYALGLGRALAESGTPPTQLDVHAECALEPSSGEPGMSDLVLDVRGQVPGCDQQTFEAAASQPTLLQSAWALPATVTVRVVARVDVKTDARAPAASVPAAARLPDVRRRPRVWRRLVLLAVLLAAALAYLAVGTPLLEDFGIGQAQMPRPIVVDPFRTAAAPTGTLAQVPTATILRAPAVVASTVLAPTASPIPATPTLPAPQPAAAPGRPVLPSVAPSPSVVTQAAIGTGFEETFASNARRWPDDPNSTAWLASGGGYRLTPRRATQFVALRAPLTGTFRDVRVTAVFRKVAGPPGGGYGVILRDQSPALLDGLTQSGRFYVFEVGDRDGIGIWRREGDQWIDILPWTPATAVHGQDGTNELIAEAHGTRLDFFVNGVLVASGEDAALAEGGVGVFTGGDGNDVLLSRFAVQPLS